MNKKTGLKERITLYLVVRFSFAVVISFVYFLIGSYAFLFAIESAMASDMSLATALMTGLVFSVALVGMSVPPIAGYIFYKEFTSEDELTISPAVTPV